MRQRRILRRKLVRFPTTSGTHWALCIDTSPIESTASRSTSYADSLRAAGLCCVVALVHFLPGEFAFEGDAVRVPIAKARIGAYKTAYHKSGGALAQTPPAARSWLRLESLAILAATSPPAPPASVHHHRALPATLADLPTLERLVCAPRATAEIFTGVFAEKLTTRTSATSCGTVPHHLRARPTSSSFSRSGTRRWPRPASLPQPTSSTTLPGTNDFRLLQESKTLHISGATLRAADASGSLSLGPGPR
ncbi:hypothetical protein B0H17DRAFT_1325628 [Mycena rosella]|uniref:Uncharacterized protein n=1 Tax=Mycena rosella TaxID=1033263 RepID=A0AAD7M9N7_MYCRO|nr:hypothetical protein B0H17DRAFT_1325628 [Mycena rosella]